MCLITVRNEVAKVMFLQASVCPQGGWGCLPQCMVGYHTPQSRHTHPPGADTPLEQTPPRADTPREQTPPRADTPWSRHPPEQTLPPPGADTLPPPEIRSLLRTVRILLECNLVLLKFQSTVQSTTLEL